ncbi:MAG: META domain-containing protein [Bacteroidota bacterium]
MQNVLLLALAALILVTIACNTSKKGTDTPKEEGPAAPDPYAPNLHDIWVLETMDGEVISREFSRPRLELYPDEGRISGTGGCNDLFGQMEALGWEITFRNIGTTKMFCRELMDTERRFLEALGEVDYYRIKDLKLILLTGDKATLVLQKID